jgi:hypothetical protein
MADLNREHPVKSTRKVAPCEGCGQPIDLGSTAIRWTGMSEGRFDTTLYHTECRAAEIAYNVLRQTGWGDWERLADMEDTDYDWLIERYPIVAKRKGLAGHRMTRLSGG